MWCDNTRTPLLHQGVNSAHTAATLAPTSVPATEEQIDSALDWIDQQMQDRCNDGSRSWCAVKGIIPPEHFDPPPATDAGTNVDEDDNPLEQLGCGCSSAAGASPDLALFALIGLGLLKRR